MKMLFGIYKGLHLGEIPIDYLKWAKRVGFIKDPLKTAIHKEIRARDNDKPGPAIPAASYDNKIPPNWPTDGLPF